MFCNCFGLYLCFVCDFFDVLVFFGFFECENGVYLNFFDVDFFFDKNKLFYIGGFFEMVNVCFYKFWDGFIDGFCIGFFQNEVKNGGVNFFYEFYFDLQCFK